MPPSDIDLPSTQVLRFPSSRKAWGKRFRPCSIAWPAVSVRLGGSMNHFRRTPHGGGAGRNRTRDYRAGADRGPLADIGHYNGARADPAVRTDRNGRSEEHTSNSSHPSISYAVFCLKKKNTKT